ncbi:T cell activation RhoGTPase activating protein b isoform X2 [Etheostoma spectabile]|uniref:T cell activation RhoGTPase activating protein b isoform X2 n=1 Tax=Etheostoma spectabile TaxID=54343 RepID=UPI0013AFCEAA|nr:T-cell activation Rho GTPase-activating protein isoform X2 [Etheostoma spectabile]
MNSPDYGVATMRRGSYDDAAASLHPHLRHLAQRRRSAPSLVFGKALPWSPIRSTASYRLKHRVSLEDIWLHGFEDEPEDEEATTGDIDLRVTLVLAWDLSFCLVGFRSPEVKEHWLDTLHRKIKDAKARGGCASSPPDVLMKVLSGSITTKTLTGGGMEQFIEFSLDGDAKTSAVSKQLNNKEDKHVTETRWNLVRRLRKGQGVTSKACRSDTDPKPQLFGQPLSKICPDECSLPKPVSVVLLLLRKRGPSTEGVFRKPCNNKNMRDVKEQLNSGLEVDLEGQPVVLLVGLLKSFLKELPGSLLVSELYDKWMAALNNEDTQQKALEIKKVVDDLPGPNKLLLQHLVCVLHHILESADTNKMDASNLAVCIAPTLLQLDGTPLDEQKEQMKKVTELTQFLIEHCEILGENIPHLLDTDADSLCSQHHDSAYDSTDPDGDGEAGESTSSTHLESGSSSSLSPSFTTSSWSADTMFDTKPAVTRRCSEPIILLSANLESLCSHSRSHDDCSMESKDFEEQPLKKQISDDSFLLRVRCGARPVSFPKLSSSSNMDPLPYMAGNCSCSSLESAASNQSESSVFTSSPVGSPPCLKRANTATQPSMAAKPEQDIPRLISDEKRRSQSMRVASKVLMRTRSLGGFSRSSVKKDSQKENSFPCGTLQEDSQSEADPPAELLHKPRPLSAVEVFKQVDSKLPCRPPSYEQAVQNTGLPPQYGSMTVYDAIVLERRSRPSSVNYDFPTTCSVNQYRDDVQQRTPFRQRAMSESVSPGHHEAVSRRCSQPVFEEFSYAKESYV